MSSVAANASTPLSLLQRLRRRGDAAAWDRFAQLYTPLLFAWARRAGLQESSAADLVQEVFVLLVRKLPEFRFEQGGSFRGWLRTVLLNKWHELHRRRELPMQGGTNLDELSDPAADFQDPSDYRQDLVHRVLQLIRSDFQPTTWEAFWQTAGLGQPARTVAAQLGISVNAVHVAKCRVLQRIRQELDGLLE